MNQAQTRRYGMLGTWTDIARRYCGCPLCDFYVSAVRRGPGSNALATAARLRGAIMRHMRERHADALEARHS